VILDFEYAPEAELEVLAIERWWQTEGDDPSLFRRELEHAITHLLEFPDAGTTYETKSGRKARRILLPKSGQWVYYAVDRAKQMLRILMLEGTLREEQPDL
jgi:hypothetical protein